MTEQDTAAVDETTAERPAWAPPPAPPLTGHERDRDASKRRIAALTGQLPPEEAAAVLADAKPADDGDFACCVEPEPVDPAEDDGGAAARASTGRYEGRANHEPMTVDTSDGPRTLTPTEERYLVQPVLDDDAPGMERDAEPLDLVNHPPHYTSHPSGIECIEITEWMGFALGNVVKYVWRADLKSGTEDGALDDLHKGAWYLAREIERREGRRG